MNSGSLKIEPFLDKTRIKNNTDNITFVINEPKFERNVLTLDRKYEKKCAYFTIMYVNNEYKMYYRASMLTLYKPGTKEKYINTDLLNNEYICLSTSKDGLSFDKKDYYLAGYNGSKKNNIIMRKSRYCHNFYPYYDRSSKMYYAITGTHWNTQGLYLFKSNDGVSWTQDKLLLTESHLTRFWKHNNHFDTCNCLVYFKNQYRIYFRDNKKTRGIQFSTTDFTQSSPGTHVEIIDNVNYSNFKERQVYTPGIFNYDDTDYLLGVPSVCPLNSTDTMKKTASVLMTSTNGVNFNILTNKMFNKGGIRYPNYSMMANGMVPSLDNKKMYIYVQNDVFSLKGDTYISCFSFEKDRIQSIVCNSHGSMTTKIINLRNDTLFINFETFTNGYLKIKLLNREGGEVNNTNNMSGNHLNFKVSWNVRKFVAGKYFILFEMYNCKLYSIYYKK